ncbi:hypothetical protein PRIPAC_77278 [Pristionchus pacificus]|uniref:Uncharacterized protein n=1 Tax=Pristionchus pacificus TaxID=54126 RepID=A0A2A6C2R7_PRIPA|nr:hypothetical protein PRIPAC_77278 [Pristionchus pacificus]|eukprot:PDM72436.1 hypothetical protein PRIPAC_38870 [Pristionchus pacificus]
MIQVGDTRRVAQADGRGFSKLGMEESGIDNDPIGKAIVLPALIRSGIEKSLGDGWLFLYLCVLTNFFSLHRYDSLQDGDQWNTEGLTLIAIEGKSQTVAKTFSPSYRTMQFKVLQTLFAQKKDETPMQIVEGRAA